MDSLRSPRLPPELLNLVASFLPLKALKAFSLCNEMFSEIAATYLFVSMHLRRDQEYMSWCLELPEHQRVALSVRRFIAQRIDGDGWISQILARALRSMPNLRSCTLGVVSRVVLQAVLDHPRLEHLALSTTSSFDYRFDPGLQRPAAGFKPRRLRLKSFALMPEQSARQTLRSLSNLLQNLKIPLDTLIIEEASSRSLRELVICPPFALGRLELVFSYQEEPNPVVDRVWGERILKHFPHLLSLSVRHDFAQDPAVSPTIISSLALSDLASPFDAVELRGLNLVYEVVEGVRWLVELVAEYENEENEGPPDPTLKLGDVLRFLAIAHPKLRSLSFSARILLTDWPTSTLGLPPCLTHLSFTSSAIVIPSRSCVQSLVAAWRADVGNSNGGDEDEFSNQPFFQSVSSKGRLDELYDFVSERVDLASAVDEEIQLPTQVQHLASLFPNLVRLEIGFASQSTCCSTLFETFLDPRSGVAQLLEMVAPTCNEADYLGSWSDDGGRLLDEQLLAGSLSSAPWSGRPSSIAGASLPPSPRVVACTPSSSASALAVLESHVLVISPRILGA